MIMTEAKKSCITTELYVEIQDYQWPIIYSSDYDISLCGLERFHSYDVTKGRNIFNILRETGMLSSENVVRPNEAKINDLLVVHTKAYLDNLRWGSSSLAELPPIGLLPNFLVDSKVLRPLRCQTGGTVLAARLALERGWAINLGGGFHHCCANRGGGFCAYADISLAVRFLFEFVPDVEKVLIVDLDASQGNGPERDFIGDNRVYIFDMYNRQVYPQDGFAKRGIKRKVELLPDTTDIEYLSLLRRHLDEALAEFMPDLVIYVAGVSSMSTDPTGRLSLSVQGIIERDQIVVQKMRTRGIPVAVVAGGGYSKDAASVSAQSILNLYNLGLINGPTNVDVMPPSHYMFVRHPSLVPPVGIEKNTATAASAGGSIWSRFRSYSINNFASLTAAVGSSDRTLQSVNSVVENVAEEEIVSDECDPKSEIARCISLPNIESKQRACLDDHEEIHLNMTSCRSESSGSDVALQDVAVECE